MTDSILITGGTGFAGSHLVDHLIEQNETIASKLHLTTYSDVPDYLAKIIPAENIHKVDLTDTTATNALIEQLKPKQLYHLAAFSSASNSFEKSRHALLNNIGLQLNILEAVQQYSPETRILVISSADGYGISESESEIPISENHPFRPINPYAVSKVAQELMSYAYAKSFNLHVVRVRPFNHIGERQTEEFAIPAFAKQIVAIERGEQQVLRVGNLSAIRDFSDVKDIVRAYVLLMEKGADGEVYNLGSGEGVAMSTVVEKLSGLASVPVTQEVDETRIRPLDIPVFIANNEKIRKLGWQPTIPLDQSLQRVLDYWRAQ